MKNVKRLTEGAVLLAVFAVLLLITIYVPFLNIIILFFLTLPFLIFAAKNDGKSSIAFVFSSLLLSFIVGTILSLPIALAFGTTGTVMGYFIRLKKNRIAILLSGTLVFLVNLIIIYSASIVLFNMDIFGEMIVMMKESLNTSAEILKNFGSAGETEKVLEQVNMALELVSTLLPTLFVLASILLVFITQLVSFPLLKRFGIKIEKWKPFKDITLPKSLLWYFLVTLLVSMFANPEEGTYLFTAIVNLTYILQFLMVLQGLAFLFYYFDKNGIAKAFAITIALVSFLVPIFLYIIGILGIIDLGFDLRKGFDKKK